jgi:hypothetical protein
LQLRRKNLKQLLMEETEFYKHELEKQKQIKKQKHENFSLNMLRQKLREQKAEHSLYHYNISQKLRNYQIRPNNTIKEMELLHYEKINDKIDPLKRNR